MPSLPLKLTTTMHPYPFCALLETHPDAKIALLPLIDQQIGGVLLVGEYGSAKSTLARSIAPFLAPEAQLLNVPLGVTADRLLGSIDIQILLDKKQFKPQTGLLEKAHNGILYLDEINLLSTQILDQLQDVATLGHYYLERDGFSKKIDAQFFLLASMNEQAGGLSDALLDRFALSLQMSAPKCPKKRQQTLEQHLSFHQNPIAFTSQFKTKEQAIKKRIKHAQQSCYDITISSTIIEQVAKKMVQCGAQGLRADIALLKAAKALAAWEAKKCVEPAHIDYLLPFVTKHRALTPPTPTTHSQPPASNKTSRQKPPHLTDPTDHLLQTLHSGDWGQMPPQPICTQPAGKKKIIN